MRARASSPPTIDHEPPEAPPRPGRTDAGAVVGGAGRLHLADHGPDRRARGGQDGLHGGGRRRGEARQRLGRALRPDRPGRPPARGRDRARGVDDPPAAGVEPGREPAYGPARPLPADLVVVDESSMLNLRMMEVLLAGLAESTHVVFVGDADQLPPIGAGRPFDDLIEAGIAPVVRLSQIFRQAARSMITTAAHEINRARRPHLEPGEDQERDFFFIDRPDPGRALATVVEVVAERAPGPLRGRPDPRRPGAGADVPGGGRDRRPQRAPPGPAQPRRPPGARRPLPGRRPSDPDPQLARPRADERLDRLPPQGRSRGGGDSRRHRRRPAEDSLRGDRRRCGSPTRSRSTRPRAARSRSSSPSVTARTRGC